MAQFIIYHYPYQHEIRQIAFVTRLSHIFEKFHYLLATRTSPVNTTTLVHLVNFLFFCQIFQIEKSNQRHFYKKGVMSVQQSSTQIESQIPILLIPFVHEAEANKHVCSKLITLSRAHFINRLNLTLQEKQNTFTSEMKLIQQPFDHG